MLHYSKGIDNKTKARPGLSERAFACKICNTTNSDELWFGVDTST